MKTILVGGATGNIGSLLVPQLLEAPNVLVRALVRDAAKAKPLADNGAHLYTGAFDEPKSLNTAMHDADTVVLIAPPGPDCVKQNASLIAAAKRAGVRKIVRISAIKSAEDGRTENTRLHGQCDRLLQESGLTYVILRPNYFMQNIFLFLDSIVSDKQFAAGMGDGRLAMIDARDVAESACAAALSDQFDNQIFEISGPASISFHDVADALSDTTGQQINYIAISPDEVKAALLGYGFDEWTANLLREYSAAFGDGWGDLVTGDVELLTGHPPRSIRQFVSEVIGPALSQSGFAFGPPA
ncbi:MAG: SDR family oxidoreductase [Gammaproteobacteria bacterium]|nr:SDR family oxidoreductase [Gammaproteobacteria bacterium]